LARASGQQNEKLASEVTGLAQTRGSGCGLLEKGDLGADSPIHVEAKSTTTDTLRVYWSWWDKALSQAAPRNKKIILLQLAFMRRYVGPEMCPELRWIGMSDTVYKSVWKELPPTVLSTNTTWAFKQRQMPLVNEKGHFRVQQGLKALCVVPEHHINMAILNAVLKTLESYTG